MVPQVVDDIFREFLGESSCRGLDRLFLTRELRPNVLVERGFQPGEKRGFLGINLWALFVRLLPSRAERESWVYLHAVSNAWVVGVV